MAAARKMQAEVDRVLKKIDEGQQAFDTLYEFVKSAETQVLKEKYEADLKKEIKKLQRYRDQVKAWVSGSEIKQKAPLVDARRSIETRMEAFKVVERETKTKAYSKEGLARESTLTPEERRRLKTREWVHEYVIKLSDEIDAMEADLEALEEKAGGGSSKKKDADAMASLETRIKNHRWHIDRLEALIRMLDNAAVEADDVEALKDDLDYYVEQSGEEGFEPDFELYDAFDLSKAGPAGDNSDSGSDADDSGDEGGYAPPPAAAAASSSASAKGGLAAAAAAVSGGAAAAAGKIAAAPAAPVAAGAKPGAAPAATVPAAAAARPGAAMPAAATAAAAARPGVAGAGAKAAEPVKPGVPTPAVPAAVPPKPALGGVTAAAVVAGKTAAAAAATPAAGGKVGPSPPASAAASGAKAEAPTGGAPASGAAAARPAESLASIVRGGVRTEGAAATSTAAPAGAAPSFAAAAAGGAAQASSTVASYTTVVAGAKAGATPTPAPAAPPAPAPAPAAATTAAAPAPGSALTPASIASAAAPAPAPAFPATSFSKTHGLGVAHLPRASSPTSPAEHLAAALAAATAPLPAPPVLDAPLVTPSVPAQRFAMHVLNAALAHVPEASDAEVPKAYVPRNPFNTHASFPSTPAPSLDPAVGGASAVASTIDKMGDDTLFFIFYYRQGTYQQHLAAKALKRNNWMFHKKYSTWFQRIAPPEAVTAAGEQGQYAYFDYEAGWIQRGKKDFTFEYAFLEDEVQP